MDQEKEIEKETREINAEISKKLDAMLTQMEQVHVDLDYKQDWLSEAIVEGRKSQIKLEGANNGKEEG